MSGGGGAEVGKARGDSWGERCGGSVGGGVLQAQGQLGGSELPSSTDPAQLKGATSALRGLAGVSQSTCGELGKVGSGI